MITYKRFDTAQTTKCDCCGKKVFLKDGSMFYYQDDWKYQELEICCADCFNKLPKKEARLYMASPTLGNIPELTFPAELVPYKKYLLCNGIEVEDVISNQFTDESDEYDRTTEFAKIEVMLLQRLYQAGVLK